MGVGGAIIGALRVILGADTAAFETGLNNAQSKLGVFGANMGKIGAGLAVGLAGAAVAVGAVGAAVSVAVKGAIDDADKLGKMAQSFGIPVEELSRLKHAADLSGVGVEELGKSVGKLSKSMMEVAGGAAGPATQAFKALGISVKESDGTLKSSTQVMTELAGKFAGMEDGAGKTALAMMLFGKSGASMIPLLNQGSAGLRDMMMEADRLGIVIDTRTAKAAEDFNDNLTRLGKVKDGIVLKITAGMLPALQRMSEAMLQASMDSKGLETVGNILGSTLKVVASIALGVSNVMKTLAHDFRSLVEVVTLLGKGEFNKALDSFKTWKEESKKIMGQFDSELQKMWSETGDAVAAKAPEIAQKLAAPIVMANENGQKALDKFFTSTQKRIALMAGEAETVGMTAGAQERLKTVLQAEAVAKENNIPLTEALTEKIRLLGESAAAAALKLQGANLAQEVMTPADLLAQKMELQRQMFEAGVISAETYGRAHRKASLEAGTAWDVAGASIAGSFSQIAGAFGKENKAMAKAAQIFGAIQATISMFTGAAKALELPFPANIAAMAAVLAKGASLVASIKGQQVPSMASGGSFTVPGGHSMTDNVMMPMALAAGERVRVDRPGQGGGDADHRVVDLRLVGGDPFPIEYMRKLLEALNELIPDGGRLRLA